MCAPALPASLPHWILGHVPGPLALRISVPTQDGGWVVSPAPSPWVEPAPQSLGEELLGEQSGHRPIGLHQATFLVPEVPAVASRRERKK